MNSRLIFLFLILLSACGVKGPPKMPAGSSVPSVEEDHPDLKLKPGTIFPNEAP